MTSLKKECAYCHLAFDVNLEDPQSVCPFCGEELIYSVEEQKHFQIAKTPVSSGGIVESTANQNMLSLSVFSQKKRNNYSQLIFWIISLIFVGLCVHFIPKLGQNNTTANNNSNSQKIVQIHPPSTPDKYIGRNYEEVEIDFKNAGFTNIQLYPLYDMRVDVFTNYVDKVDSITINGNIDFDTTNEFPSDANVKISYHSWANDKK